MGDIGLLAGLAALVAAGLALFVALRGRATGPKGPSDAELIGAQLKTLQDAWSGQLGEISRRLDEGLKESRQLVSDANRTVVDQMGKLSTDSKELHTRLGELANQTAQVMDLGKSMAGLEAVLKPPKARGGLGEFLLESLLSQMLPRENYDLQYRFKDGTAVDAVVRFKDWLLPIDSKFPLENFERHLKASEEADRRRFFKEFMADCVKHVEKIAKTYIRPEEKTLDTAFMYVPAENVYYHMLIPPEGFEGKPVLETAWERRVIPVSPNTLYAYLQVILVGLKGMKVEEKAREVFELLSRMKRMFESFSEEHEKLGGHLTRAKSSYDSSAAKLEKLGSSLGAGELLPGPEGPIPGDRAK